MLECWFFQPIQHKARPETGAQEDVQGTVEGVVRSRLTYHAHTLLWAKVQVLGDLDGEGRDVFTVDGVLLSTKGHARVVEARVREGKDKATLWFHDLAKATHQWVDLGHVHDGHVADGSIEAVLAQSHDLLLAGGIQELIVKTIRLLAGARTRSLEEDRAEISGKDEGSKVGQTA